MERPPGFIALFPGGSAEVAELADATDLKSVGTEIPCEFESHLRHMNDYGYRISREEHLRNVYRLYQDDPRLGHLWDKRFVPGKGPLPARIMLVGEAPGADEDAAGEPFVGAAGKILNLLIRRANLRRQDIFITNVVKYRPTGDDGRNRTPTGSEIDISLLYLDKEIKVVGPQVIGLMGRIAIQTFFGGKSPAKNHGEIWRAYPNSRPIVFLYHPAFAAYSKSYLQTLIDDFKSIPKALEQSGDDGSTTSEPRE